MDFYPILQKAHSGWRYLVLVLLLAALLGAISGWLGKKTYTEGSRKLNTFALISTHIQVLLGLVLYFMGGWFKVDTADKAMRYWKMEHIGMMILAVVLITIGNSKSKKVSDAVAKHRTIAVFFGIAFIIIIGSIFMMTKNVPGRTFFGS
jgi:hypothetical protein